MMNEKDILQDLIKRGIISESDILDLETVKKREKVLEVHKNKIFQGEGKDKRWCTVIYVDGKRKILKKKTEKELIDYLYDHYYGEKKSYKDCTLTDIYDEWIQYKLTVCRRANTVHRIETDYKRFYLNEPLSNKIMTTPLANLTVADVEEWAYGLIHKYDLTIRAYSNMSIILRQVYKYLMKKDVLTRSPFDRMEVTSKECRIAPKKPAETQIFYADEVAEIIKEAKFRAEQTKDVGYLAIPFFFYTGTRIGECLALEFDDIDAKNYVIHITKMFAVQDVRKEDGTWEKRKFSVVDFLKCNSAPRDVVVSQACLDLVEEIKRMHNRKNIKTKNLFPNISEANVTYKLYRICSALGYIRRSSHKWRKTYISNLLNKGADVDFVRAQVGHKDIQTTYNYYTYSTTKKEEQIKQLSKILVV